MAPTSSVISSQQSLVRSYLFLRRAVGIIGMALPAVLILGRILLGEGGLLNSISGYYYSVMGGVFVGGMCAVGTFLLSYRGYDRLDNLVGNIAAVAAIGVGLLPTAPSEPSNTERFVGYLHLACAVVFFLSLAAFCLFLFTKTGGEPLTRKKTQRNRVYRTCGVVMVACLVLIPVSSLLPGELKLVLWLESAAIVAFGVAWWVKGETLLRDP